MHKTRRQPSETAFQRRKRDIKATPNERTEVAKQIAKLSTKRTMLWQKHQVQKIRRQHPQRTLRPHAPKLTQNEKYAKKMVKVRSKTVEPVIGTLVNFTNMKRVNTRGIKNANKHVLMASLTYNLKKKKYLLYHQKPSILAQVHL